MGFRHVVMFRWNAAADAADRRAAAEALSGLPAQIPEILGYCLGADVGRADGNWDFAVVADFADAEGYAAYRDHPAHRAVLAERVRPLVAERASVQIRTDD